MKKIAQLSGLVLKQLVNSKGQTFKKLKPDLDSMNAQEIVSLIQENPAIMVRPILTDGNQLLIGFKEAEYQSFLEVRG